MRGLRQEAEVSAVQADEPETRRLSLAQKPFQALRRAREALQARAEEMLEEYIRTIRMAVAAGKYDEALRGYQWLLDHTPGTGGLRLFDSSVDKQAHDVAGGHKGPVVQIGIKVGGTQPELPQPEVGTRDP